MAALSADDTHILEASLQDVSIFTEYYFGVKMMPHQIVTAHAKQPSILTLGGRGSGKTFGWVFVYIWLATVMPDFRALWTSYTSDQAAIGFYDVAQPYILASDRFHKFLPEGDKSLKKKPYPEIHIKIPGTNLPESLITFKPSDAGGGGDTKRGFTLDAVHFDEGGLITDGRVITNTRRAMRGRRHAPGNPPRLGRMSVSTTPTHADWLRHWWESANNSDYPDYAPDKYLALRVRSGDNYNLTKEQIDLFHQDSTPEEIQVELEAEFPEYMGNEFSPVLVNGCQDNALNHRLDDMIERREIGADKQLLPKIGLVKYQMPVINGHHYILSGDPGTGNPPYRNAACIMVFDVSTRPYELVFFEWVSGCGSYKPFFARYNWAYNYYRPVFAVIDATGTQKAMDELYLEANDIYVEGMSVTSEKPAMINATKILMQKGLVKFPYIQGLRLQLLNYVQEKDKKLAQDIVMTLVMAAWKMRILHYQDVEEMGGGDPSGEIDDRNVRDADRARGRPVNRERVRSR